MKTGFEKIFEKYFRNLDDVTLYNIWSYKISQISIISKLKLDERKNNYINNVGLEFKKLCKTLREVKESSFLLSLIQTVKDTIRISAMNGSNRFLTRKDNGFSHIQIWNGSKPEYAKSGEISCKKLCNCVYLR